MKPNLPPFMEQVKARDPEFYEVVSKVMELALAPGALEAKTKVLISLALDAASGAERGVMVLAKQARQLGASEQEINEVLRLVYSVSGSRPLITSNNAFPVEK